MRALFFILMLSACTYDEVCTPVVVPDSQNPHLSIARCELRQCVTIERTQFHRLTFRLPDERGTHRLEDLHAEECVDGKCTTVTGTIVVHEVVPSAEKQAIGKLDADAEIDAPSTFEGKALWRYGEHWDETCRDVEWPDMNRLL